MTVPSGYQPLAGSQRPRPAGATLVGPLAPATNLSATLLLRQRPGSPALPDLSYWQQIPPGRRTFLSPDELTQVYGAAPAEISAVTTFVTGHGMTVVESHAGRRCVIVRGTAAQWSTAFGVALNQYQAPLPVNPYGVNQQTPGAAAQAVPEAVPVSPAPVTSAPPPAMQTFRGFDGQAYLPPQLAGVVESIIGLDNRIAGCRAGTGDPPLSFGLSAPELAGLYNFPNTGAGCQTIGVFAPAPAAYLPSDITGKYFPSLPKGFNTPPKLTNINLEIDGTTYTNNPATVTSLTKPFSSLIANDSAELTQDISTSATIAQGANVNVYFNDGTEQGWLTFLARAIFPNAGENQPSALTASWTLSLQDDSGTIGSVTDSGSIAYALSVFFAFAAIAGITVFVALGDWGADDQVIDGHCHTSFPSSDPWVVSCGGTVLGDITLGPPLHFTEFVWSDAFSSSPFGKKKVDFGATGGGVSDNFAVPIYQALAKITPTSKNDGGVRRGVPDVAGMVALTGFFLNAHPYSFVGTSCVAPLYAGLTAVLNQILGQPIGLLHPTLYLHPSICNDVTFGNNDSGDTPDSPFYTAAAGWDPCTGLGSVDGARLLGSLITGEEVTIPVDVNNPFNFSYPPGENGWAVGQGYGASDSFDSLDVGQYNTADNFGGQYGPYGAINHGDGDGPDLYGDVTVLNTAVGYNATFAGDNIFTGEGSIGLYGRSRGSDFSIGVLGQSSTGAGLYGLATDENPSASPCEPAHGIGVVGRSMGGLSPEGVSVERMVGEPIGVLGQSTTGPGVRGHGGPLFMPPAGPNTSLPVTASPGGVFSAGRLQKDVIGTTTQQVSLDSLSQLRLVPTLAAKLPTVAQVGDLFLVFLPGAVGTADVPPGAALFLCTHFAGDVPQWQQVQLGTSLAGGSTI
ncbi:MAG: S53 family peptidase [Acidobacteriaceae bacterium]